MDNNAAHARSFLTWRSGAGRDLNALVGDPGGDLKELGGVGGQAAHHQRLVPSHHETIPHTGLVGLQHRCKQGKRWIKTESISGHETRQKEVGKGEKQKEGGFV